MRSFSRLSGLQRLFRLLLLLALPVGAAEDYALWAYSSRFAINTTASGAGVASAQADFPILVRLPSSHPAFTQAKADGADLRFADPDGAHLVYEIERWDKAAKKAEIWVRIPKVDGNSDKDSFLMHWGMADAPAQSNGVAVFGAGTGAYFNYHLSEKGNAARVNSAAPGVNATPVNYDGDEDREGLIGRCDSLDGSAAGDYLALPSGFQDIGSGFTFSAWQWSTNFSEHARLMDLGNGQGLDNLIISRWQEGNGACSIFFEGYVDVGGWGGPKEAQREGTRILATTGMEIGRWRHVAMTYANENMRIFVDGIQVASGNTGVGLRSINRTRNYLGRSNWADDDYFRGKLDELGFARTVRSADWVKLTFESQKAGAKVLAETLTPPRVFSLVSSTQGPMAVLEGENVSLTATILADTSVSYGWYRSGASSPVNIGILTPNGGALNAALFFPAITLAQAGSYTCLFNNGKDTLRTTPATVTVGENLALWGHTLKILFNTKPSGGDIPESVGNLPIPLRLDDRNFDFSAASSGGADIRVTDPDGSVLSHQVASWDVDAKRAEVWVRVPLLDGNSDTDFITLHWGRAGAASTSNGPAVFRAEQSWLGVWHLGDPAGRDVVDAGTKGNIGKNTDATALQPGTLGKAMAFNGLSSRVALPTQMTSGLKAWTVNLWVKETQPRVCTNASDLICPALFGGEVSGQGSGDFRIVSNQGQLGLHTGLVGADQPLPTAITLADGRWHFVAATFDGAKVTLYEAGKALGVIPAASRALEVTAFDIGNINWHDDTHTNALQGLIDEVQFSTMGHGANWVKAAYEVQRDDGLTVNYGTVDKVAPPTPAFSPGAGAYPGPLQVTLLSADQDADLYYTLDGSIPKPGQAGTSAFTGPFTLTQGARVMAVADREGLTSPAVWADYSVIRMLRARDTLRPGEEGILPGDHTLRYPPKAGGPAVLVSVDTSGAAVPAGFEAKGPLITLTTADGSAFPPLIVQLEAYQPPTTLFRLAAGGRAERISVSDSSGASLDIGSGGTWFWGLDIQAPTLSLPAYPTWSADSLRAAVLPEDNVSNLACRLEWWAGAADSTAWIPCAAGRTRDMRAALANPGFRALEVRLSVSDGSISAHHPEGASHALTVSHPLPSAGLPVKLSGNRSWSLAALPLSAAGPVRLRDLASANPGGALAAGLWRGDPSNPGQGGYHILSGDDTLPLGAAVWISAEKPLASLSLPGARSLASDSLGSFPVRLVPGWNQVGGRALRALPWIASRDDGDEYLRSDVKVLHRFTGDGYAETDSLRAWEGCFAYHHGGDTVVRLHPVPAETGPVAKRSAFPGESPSAEGVTWTIRRTGGAGGPVLRLGARGWTSDGPGVEDEPLPPPESASGATPGARARLLRGGRAWGSDYIRLRSDSALRWTVTAAEGLSVTRLDLPAGWQAWALTRGNGGFSHGGVRLRIVPGSALPSGQGAGTGDTLLLLAGTPSALAALPEWGAAREAPIAAEASLRRSPRGPELFLALPGNAQVTWYSGSADGRRLAGSRSRLGPGWHHIPLDGGTPGRCGGSAGVAGVFWVRVEASGQGWRLVRTLPFSRL